MSKSRSGAPRRVAVGLLAGALTVFGIALAPSAGAVDDVNGDRLGGQDRYDTAAIIAGQPDFDGATTAILATGENFPDALAASGIAGVNAPAPIILTQSDVLTQSAEDALTALDSLTTVIIVGGTAAVASGVEDEVSGDGYDVTRLAGNDRYETAAEIANEMGPGSIGQVDGEVTALIASGENFPDALAGGPASYANSMPILLVHPNEVPQATADAIADLGIDHLVILGGTAAVSNDVQDELDGITGGDSERVAGTDRFETAVAVMDFNEDVLGFDGTEVFLANGLNFPDALAGGPIAGERQASILLVTPDELPDSTATQLDDNSDVITDVTALGGTAAISEDVLDQAINEAETTDNDNGNVPTNTTATSRPELVSASIVETRTSTTSTATRPAGTYVQYCFDEAIAGAPIVAGSFFLYAGDGTRFAGTGTETGTGQTFTSNVDATNNKCANVIFGGPGVGAAGSGTLDTAAEASVLTLATVDNGAVTGAAGAAGNDTNIEGDAPLTPAASSSAAAGATAAPDLLSVGNFKAGSSDDVTSVDFTFDAAAFVRPGADFRLVNIDGSVSSCSAPASGSTTASGLAAPGGEGTTVITVACADPVATVAGPFFNATNTARGTVGRASVAATIGGTSPNPLEAADVVGTSDGPDLTLVLFSPDAVVNQDVVSYLFDEDVKAGTGPSGVYLASGSFGIYNTAGTERLVNSVIAGGTEYCARSSEGNYVVSCVLADGVLSGATYVGGNVRAGAVTEVNGLGTLTNQADEEGTTPSSGSGTGTTGKTDGPDLTGVALNPVVSPFGNTTYSATYTFDEDVADTGSTTATVTDNAAAGNSSTGENVITQLLHLYTADGIRLDCTSLGLPDATTVLTARTEDTDNTVVCTTFTVSTGAAATQAQVHGSVVGTVDYGAVDDETVGGDTNPEGAELASGSNGTAV